jgi:hypothetical protein
VAEHRGAGARVDEVRDAVRMARHLSGIARDADEGRNGRPA